MILGTLIRTCTGLNWSAVFLSDKCSDPFNDKCIRASRGCSHKIPLIYNQNVKQLISYLEKEKWNTFIADVKGKPFTSVTIPAKTALVLGSEAHGVSSVLQSISKATQVTIPLNDNVESLNVATAGAILMNHFK